RSGRAADGFNAAVAWDVPPRAAPPPPPPPPPPEPLRLSPAEPEGPIHARYRIEPRGRSPGWSPVAVFDDGTRTFITLAPEARRQDSPALFVLSASGEAELANYRQSEGVLVVDRVFERAELRLGVRRPQVVRLTRLESDR
ncbi:MAG: type IV secretory pathway VirB9-like protein, partial [Brevundimonas sp.]|uniref:TrbG/VirB9 family P-type conjugative transfer protein n=1 Tax=Brevundimonas sp. TaxID=1871086 RepID=UPI0039E6AD20